MRTLALTIPLITIVIAVISGAYADEATPDRTYFYRGGLFAQLADCQAVLPAQQKLFQEQTGLTPTAVSCIQGRDFDPHHPLYSPAIDAVGTPAKRLYDFDAMRFGTQSSPKMTAFIHSLIQKVATVALDASDEIFYYNDGPLEISNIEVSFFDTASECTSQLDALRSAYQQGGVTTMLGECFLDDISNSTQMIAAWTGENTTVAEDHALTSAVYPTFQSCMDATSSVLAQKRAALPAGKHIYGAVCETHEDANAANDGYAIDLFWDNF